MLMPPVCRDPLVGWKKSLPQTEGHESRLSEGQRRLCPVLEAALPAENTKVLYLLQCYKYPLARCAGRKG